MRDGCSLVRLGKPVVVVVQAIFESAARVHAKGSGCPDLPICSYPHPPAGADTGHEAMDAIGAALYDKVMAALAGKA